MVFSFIGLHGDPGSQTADNAYDRQAQSPHASSQRHHREPKPDSTVRTVLIAIRKSSQNEKCLM